MAQNTILLILATIWSLGLTVPLPTSPSVLNFETDHAAKDDNETIFDKIESANKGIPMFLREGDIAEPTRRNARKCEYCRWDKSSKGIVTVPYVIASQYTDSEKNVIISGLQEFSTVSCIRFQDRTTESNYLSIENGQGCWSFIGRIGGPQTVSLDKTKCVDYGVAQHEVMHAISFQHEHTRSDRGNYVDVMWQYINPQNQKYFEVDHGDTLGIGYDYNSVMHYGRNSFCNTTGMSSLVPKPDSMVFIGQRDGLSNLDVQKINKLYNCNLCRTKLLGVSGTLSSYDSSPVQHGDNCLWLIHAPSNKILLKMYSFISSSGNCSAVINVYDGVNLMSPLLAKIIPGQSLPLLISSSKFMLVEYIRDNSIPSSFSASYNSVLYGATFTTDKGTVVSPMYPNYYSNNVIGTWIIIAPTGYRVSLTFSVFDLESSPSCSSDFLVVRNGGGLTAPILGTYCGYISNLKLTSSGQMMLLQFSSNLTGKRPGFKANYSFIYSR